MLTATPVKGAVCVRSHEITPDGVQWLTLDNHADFDWEGYRDAPAALRFDGLVFAKCSFDSDRHTITYRTDWRIAFTV